jgi:subtilisin family serine protease
VKRLAAVAALLLASPASAAELTVGVAADVSRDELAASVAAATGGTLVEDLGPLEALVFDVADADAAAAHARLLPGVEYAEPVVASRRLVFTPNDPLLDRQWYLNAIKAFDHWPEQPPQPPVLVAVVDSGIDGSHPEFAGRIARARTFVSTPARTDEFGHGTVVAGEIAAALGNAQGIAGTGIPVRLLVAKVVSRDGRISLLAEARAIRWAADRGARVINLSLGGPRDPTNPRRDTYSRLEHAAIDYATRRGAIVVAAAGNCLAPVCPERFASYPAALPHVIGVSSVAPDGSSPSFSNRDRVFNDLAAPGTDIFSTYPGALSVSGCSPAGYTACADRPSIRSPRGTSFSAPLATAAASVLVGERGLLGLRPLHASQITQLLKRTASDLGTPGRDQRSGHGRLNVAAAVDAVDSDAIPPRDRFEANDDAGSRAFRLSRRARTVIATLDRFEDVRDVYRLRLAAGQRVGLRLEGRGNANLFLWRPGTTTLLQGRLNANRIAASVRPGSNELIAHRARRTGFFYVEVRLGAGRVGRYRLTIARS